MRPGYDPEHDGWWQPVDDCLAVLLGAGAVVGVWQGGRAVLPALLLALAVGAIARRVDVAVLLVTLVSAGAVLGDAAWRSVAPDALGPYRGWVTVRGDPEPAGKAMRVVLEVEGERFRALVYGARRHRLERLHDGERVQVVGERVALGGTYRRSQQVRHIVGDLRIEYLGDTATASPLRRASNRMREVLRRGAERTMAADQAALFLGLVIGDDSRQPASLVEAFRAAGLSHLTAVSGQNVAYVLALAGLVLRRLRRWWRLAATLALISWFVVLTRAEPSVVRAGAMAAWSAVAFALGRERSPLRTLCLAAVTLVFVDPLLVWSVGFWLSVGATAGVCVVAPALATWLAGPTWLVAPLSVTLGAQLGVLLPSVLVFHRLPVLGTPANLLAVPVAGFVMLYGIPAALAAAVLPEVLARVVMWPCTTATRWVSVVAELAARLQPSGVAAVAVGVLELALVGGLAVARWRGRAAPVRR
jgi:competence protein ComEC